VYLGSRKNNKLINRAWWERVYALGYSGRGSRGKYRDWKWGIIGRYIPDISSVDVIDVGCGNLEFWAGRKCAKYLGIDWSSVIISKNRRLWAGLDFLAQPAEQYIPDIKATVVFCFDLLIHIETAAVFRRILENLCRYSKDLIFVYNWINSRKTDGRYSFYHPLEEDMDVFQRAGFCLLERHVSSPTWPRGAIYVFRKEIDK